MKILVISLVVIVGTNVMAQKIHAWDSGLTCFQYAENGQVRYQSFTVGEGTVPAQIHAESQLYGGPVPFSPVSDQKHTAAGIRVRVTAGDAQAVLAGIYNCGGFHRVTLIAGPWGNDISITRGSNAQSPCEIKAVNPHGDSDNDGVLDSQDNCPNNPNTSQEDSDSDGVGDVCDRCPNNPNEHKRGIQ